MAIRVDANGDGTNDNVGSYVSVYALLLEGKYDTELSWSFVGKVTFILLNHLEDTMLQRKQVLNMTCHEVCLSSSPTPS